MAAGDTNQADWEKYRVSIRDLIVTEGKTLEDVLSYLGIRGFKPTYGLPLFVCRVPNRVARKSQLRTQLRKWSISKNIPGKGWQAIEHVRLKRRRLGKESAVFRHGRRLQERDVNKKVHRHVKVTRSLRSGAFQSHPEYHPREHFRGLLTELVEDDALSFPDREFGEFFFQARDLAERSADTVTYKTLYNTEYVDFQHPSQEFRSLFSGYMDGGLILIRADIAASVQIIAEKLECTMPLSHDEIALNLRQLIGPERKEKRTFQAFSFALYLSSNNFLSREDMDNFSQWLIQERNHWIAGALLAIDSPTTDAFFANLLMGAVTSHDARLVWRLINGGVDLSRGRSPYGRTPLQHAVEQDSVEMAQILLKAGADANAPAFGKCSRPHIPKTALQIALSCRNDAELVQILLHAGADVNAVDICSATLLPIQYAARYSSIQVVQLLMDAGAKVNIMTSYSGTALQAAAHRGDLELVEFFLKANADVNAPLGRMCQMVELPGPFAEFGNGSTGQSLLTPLQAAAVNDDVEMVRTLLKWGAETNPQIANCSPVIGLFIEYKWGNCRQQRPWNWCRPYNTALQIAAQNGNVDIIQMLLAHNSDVDTRACERHCQTALQLASAANAAEAACYLLFYGADVNAPSPEHGKTALQSAAATGNTGLVKLLMEKGADINAPASDGFGRTALQAAAASRSIEVAQILLDAGAEINKSIPLTALQAATQVDSLAMVTYLISKNADVNESGDEYYLSPTDQPTYATFETDDNIYDPESDSHSESSEEIKLVIERELGNDKGCLTALQQAATNGNVEMTRTLLGAGANVNAPPLCRESGRTALQAAVESNHKQIAELLLEAGADVNSPASDRYGVTALQASAMRPVEKRSSNSVFRKTRQLYDYELLYLLLSRGADPNLPASSEGYTVLEALMRFGRAPFYHEAIRRLLKANVNVTTSFARYSPALPPLEYAAIFGTCETLEILLEADVQVELDSGLRKCQALQSAAAARVESLEKVKLLIAYGVDVNATPTRFLSERTALQAAVERGNVKTAEFLLSHGADVNASAAYKGGVTALQAASIKGHIRLAQILLRAGADPNAPSAAVDGRTALEGAAEHGRLEMLQLLLNHDREPETLDRRCKGAAEFAANEAQWHCAKFLEGYIQSCAAEASAERESAAEEPQIPTAGLYDLEGNDEAWDRFHGFA